MDKVNEKSFPFDAKLVNGRYDRVYKADDFTRYFRAFITSGVFMEEASNLQVLANGDMTVTLKPGKIIIEGYRYDVVNDIVIPIAPADGILNRIDRISITWSQKDRDIHYTVLQGKFAGIPENAECRRTADYMDYIVADIYVAAGSISINQSAITDQRLNSKVCGLAVPFSKIDTTMIFNQLQAFYQQTVAENAEWKATERAAFDKWFNDMKSQLTEDVAGKLQSQIDGIDGKLDVLYEELFNSATDSDIDRIILGTYDDEADEGGGLTDDIATDEDIDAIINGAYEEGGSVSDEETADFSDIDKIIETLF